MHRPHRSTALVGVSAAMLAGCANYAGITSSATAVTTRSLTPGAETVAAGTAPAWPTDAWWEAYGDAQLDALIDLAMQGSPDLQIARSRVDQAAAYAALSRASTLPKVEAQSNLTRTFAPQAELTPSPSQAHSYWDDSLLLKASYDLDLWGKNRRALEASIDTVHAAELDAATARLTLVTAVVQTYVELSLQYALRDTTEANLRRQQQILDIAVKRHAAGIGTLLEINQASTVVPDTEGRLQQIDEAISAQQHQLAALSGRGPGDGETITRPSLALGGEIRIPADLQSNLLGHRPDIVAQRWRIESALKTIDVAKARFYPDVNLAAFAGFASLGLTQWVGSENREGGFGPAISLPIFDAGALRANLKVQTAAFDVAVETYNRTVVDAMQDVADQVDRLHSTARQMESTAAALDFATRANDEARLGFREGLTDYLSVLNTQAELLNEERSQSQLLARKLTVYAALMKSLGGGYAQVSAAALRGGSPP